MLVNLSGFAHWPGVLLLRRMEDTFPTLQGLCSAARAGDCGALVRLLAEAPHLATATSGAAGQTALMCAVRADQQKTVRLLLAAAPAAALIPDDFGT